MRPEPVAATAPPLPRPHLLRQQWLDVSFLHWAVPADSVAHLMPPGVRPDVHQGRTYVGLVPFRLVGTAIGAGPSIPWAGTFLETNVRLYSVDDTGRRGVVFLSLDAERALAVAVARTVFALPYRWSRMSFAADGDTLTYVTARRSRVVVRRTATALDGELERFLTARWGLHVARANRTRYLPNDHEPWPLYRAEAETVDDTLLTAAGLGALSRRPPDHVAYSPGVTARFGPPA